MLLSKLLAPQLPFLRRYARALTGSQTNGDAFVRATLEALLADPSLIAPQGDIRVSLYGLFHGIWESAHIEVDQNELEPGSPEHLLHARLNGITPLTRQALLLSTLEGFSHAQAGVIMDLEESVVVDLVNRALEDIEQESPADVLIIEDEPLIAMQLEQLVETLGHRVTGLARTHHEAIACCAGEKPSLILADIQLADGSSGIEAVAEILAAHPVPVIFITAFPERLLTGERPEPTFLITKPFQESTVQAAISQALFLGGGGHNGRIAA